MPYSIWKLFEILVMWLEMRKFFAYSAWFQSCISVKTKQLKLELFKLFSLNLKQCLKLSGFAPTVDKNKQSGI